MKRNINSGETLMEHCLAPPEIDPNCAEMEPQVPDHPVFDLIVLEVYVKDPRGEEEEKNKRMMEEVGKEAVAAGAGIGGGKRRPTNLKGGRLPPMKETTTSSQSSKPSKYVLSKAPIIDLEIELHQVVGTFSTFSERAPASIDTGMFSWAEMKEFGSPVVAEVEEKVEMNPEDMTAAQVARVEKKRRTAPEWEPYGINPRTGESCVCVFVLHSVDLGFLITHTLTLPIIPHSLSTSSFIRNLHLQCLHDHCPNPTTSPG